MIEGAVLVEDDDEMLDRRFRVQFMRVAMVTVAIMITVVIVLTGEHRNAACDRSRNHAH